MEDGEVSLPDRVKEVFVMFDTKNNGFLSIDEMGKLLKKLGGFTHEDVAGFCSDMNKSGEGKVSYREFVEWIRKGGGRRGQQVGRAIIRETDKRAARIKATFDRYDESGDGSLDLEELTAVLKSMGAFTKHEIRIVLEDLDENGDGDISFEEFEEWVKKATDIKAVIKAKCILAPSDSDGIEAVFYNWCGPGNCEIDGRAFVKLIRDSKLLNSDLNEISADLIFSDHRVKPRCIRRADFSQFEKALELIAERRGSSVEEVKNAVGQCVNPSLSSTKTDAVRFYDSPDDGSPKKKRRPKARAWKPQKLPLVGPVELSAPPADNSDMWKIFGPDSPAGKSLKCLYISKECTPALGLSTSRSGLSQPLSSRSLSSASDTYVAVSPPGACRYGIRFRRSMYLADIDDDPLAVMPWGASIKGDTVGFSWLKVGNRFLPTVVNGVQVMKKWTATTPHPNPHNPGLNKSSSLPAIHALKYST